MPIPSRDAILDVLSRESNPLRLQSIAAELRVKEEDTPGLLRLLDDMVFSGQLLGHSGTMFSVPRRGDSRRQATESSTVEAAPPQAARGQKLVGKEDRREAERRHESEDYEFRSHRDQKKKSAFEAKVFAKKKHDDRGAKGGPPARPSNEPFHAPTRKERRSGHATPPAEARPIKAAASAGRTPVQLGANEREGFLTVNARGFGFLSSVLHPQDDVFIEADRLGGAMHGDRVKVKVLRRKERGVEGELLEILERGTKRVAGILRRKRASAWLEPDDTRIRGPIQLPEDGAAAHGEGNSGMDGDLVIVRITRYPDYPGETAVGKLETVLGRPGELRSETAKIVALAQVDELHDDVAFEEASAYGETVPDSMLEGRVDLTHVPLPTIDPEDARDHDDAVWVERRGDGYRAYIAIADVSAYVRPGTKLDDEALTRGCSVYLPDRAIPMLPRPLSSNLCSLLPDVTRLCLCAEVELDSEGAVTKYQLHRGFMKSQAKLTYGGVARALGLSEKPPVDPKAEAFLPGLKIAYELSRKLRKRRIQRGAIDFEVPESKIVFDEKNEPADVVRRSEDPGLKQAYQLIEELMLLANEVVAGWAIERDVPTIFRVHAPPDEEKLARFASMCEVLGVPFDAEDTRDPKRLAKFVRSFADHPRAAVLNMLLLRSMKQAAYDTANIGHFGLASSAYLHFTSPIRRYPDVLVHRGVHAVLLREKIRRDSEARGLLQDAALRSSQNERRAMEVERDVGDLYKAWLMKDRVGERFEGTITGLVGQGAFVALDGPFVDVFVRTEGLGGGTYELSDDNLRLYSSRSGDMVQLGDRIVVEVVDVNISRRQITAKRFGMPEQTEDRWGRGAEIEHGAKRFAKKSKRSKHGSGRGREAGASGRNERRAHSERDARPGDRKGRPTDRNGGKKDRPLPTSGRRPAGGKKKGPKRRR